MVSQNPQPHADGHHIHYPLAKALALIRLELGATFLWAFLDKLFGLGFTTKSANSWIHGGHPTKGYLSSSIGPLEGMFKGMAGNVAVDTLFMLGLAGVGLALLLGVANRFASWSGFAMVTLMYFSHPIPWSDPHTPHPFLDDHVLEAFCFIALAVCHAGDTWGLGRRWRALTPKTTWLH